MSFGSNRPQRTVNFVKFVATNEQKQPEPKFVIDTKDEKGNPLKLIHKEFGGYITNIEQGSYVYQGDTERTIKIHLVDGKDYIKLEMNINSNYTRNVVNRLLGTAEYHKIDFSTWLKKADPKKPGSTPMPAISVKNDGAPMDWVYGTDAPEIAGMVKEVPDPKSASGKMVKVYHELNTFLLDRWNAHAPAVRAWAKEQAYDTYGGPRPKEDPNKPLTGDPFLDDKTTTNVFADKIRKEEESKAKAAADEFKPDGPGDGTDGNVSSDDDIPF